MRCEYPDQVAPNCLCPEKKPPEGGAPRCRFKTRGCKRIGSRYPLCYYYDKIWGNYNYSDPKHCTKLNVIIDRPLGTICSEHAHCAVGLLCSDGVCSTCPEHVCPDRMQSDKLSVWGKTCKYGEYECPHGCARKGEGCSPTNLGLGCCGGLKYSSGGKCITDKCKVDGDCTEDDDDICQGYFCFNDKVVSGEGRECYIEDNGVSSNCSISGTFCDVESNTCRRSYEAPRVIRNYVNAEECEFDYGYDEGLYCKPQRGRDGGKCSPCLVDEVCPEKGRQNSNTCKRGEYNCPDVCLSTTTKCLTTDPEKGKCCHNLKCGEEGLCRPCKKSGECSSDDECCDKYGCHENNDGSRTVIYAGGQNCNSDSDCLRDTKCHKSVKVCY